MLDHLGEFLGRSLRHTVFIVGLVLDTLGVLVLWRANASQLTVAWPYLLLLLAAAFVVASFFVFQEERRKNEPQPLADLLHVEPERRPSTPRPGSPNTGGYLGIKCDNQTDREVSNCRVRLESLEKWLPDSGSWFSREPYRPLLLAWSFNDGGGDTRTIGARSNRTCDLVAYESQNDTQAKIIAAQDRLRASNVIGFGRWRATCRVEADQCLPLDLEVTFIWEPRNTPMGQMRTLDFLEPLRILGTEGSPRAPA